MENGDLHSKAAGGDAAAQVILARKLLLEGRSDEGEGWLRRAVEGGSVDAMAALGQYLFLGRPPVPDAVLQESVKLSMQAANAGHAEAAHLVALIAANDPSIPDHWAYATDYLARAAMVGHRLAQFEMAIISGNPDVTRRLVSGETLAPETWPMLRNSLNMPALLAVPPLRDISTSPKLSVCEGFATPETCDWIIHRSKPLLAKAKSYGRPGEEPVMRSCSEIEYPFPELDILMMILRHRLATLTGLSQAGMEPPSVIHYLPGQQFTAHFDYLHPEALADEIARTGQCAFTLLLYLNDDFEGGETGFTDIGLRFKGKKGDALIFRNIDEAGNPDPNTRHAGLPPTRGEKWLLSQFVRNGKQSNKLPGS